MQLPLLAIGVRTPAERTELVCLRMMTSKGAAFNCHNNKCAPENSGRECWYRKIPVVGVDMKLCRSKKLHSGQRVECLDYQGTFCNWIQNV